jgi:type I restriction enzyme, S subunit
VELRPGYKQTDFGVIPEDWIVSHVGAEFSIQLGKMLDAEKNIGVSKPYLGNRAVQWGRIDLTCTGEMKLTPSDLHRFRLREGDLLVCEGGEIGRAAIWDGPIKECYYQKALHRLRPVGGYNVRLMLYMLNRLASTGFLQNFVTQTSIAHLPKDKFETVPIAFPPRRAEQRAIVEALGDADSLIESLAQLLTKKRQIRQGAMQELLTGKRRLPGFSGAWDVKRIAEIAAPSSEKNSAREALTVLTCSKHMGFVDSLGYFKNQVFSKDTSGYKIIRRGQIGYPSNHVEEGSIGLQDLYDVALVSPIYVVFSVSQEVGSYFLHRLLKLDSYRQEFATATSSSVDRRGSLRWPAFSQITVRLPPVEEQAAIAAVLSDTDAEITALEERLDKSRQIKQGMMQELLTGRIRLI